MSTRFYPIYQRGNPQLRVFLPNFWMKIVKSQWSQPNNVVTFAVSMEMTKHDIKNYLRKIYQLPVVDVRTRIAIGKTARDRKVGYITKEEDSKLAYVTFPREVTFKFPDIFPSEAEEKEKKREDERALESSKEEFQKFIDKNKNRKGLPGWFSF